MEGKEMITEDGERVSGNERKNWRTKTDNRRGESEWIREERLEDTERITKGGER